MYTNGQELEEYKLNFGFGETLKLGGLVYRGSDYTAMAYTVDKLRFESGYGVRIVTRYWSDCGLWCAASLEGWKKERVKYLEWLKEGLQRQMDNYNKEIEKVKGS